MARGFFARALKFLNMDNEDEEFGYAEDYPAEEVERDVHPRKGRIFPLHSARQDEIVILAPPTIDDAKVVADNLKGRSPVIVKLANSDEIMSQRIVDFISGITYALDGHIQALGDDIILFTPCNVSINSTLPHTLPDED